MIGLKVELQRGERRFVVLKVLVSVDILEILVGYAMKLEFGPVWVVYGGYGTTRRAWTLNINIVSKVSVFLRFAIWEHNTLH